MRSALFLILCILFTACTSQNTQTTGNTDSSTITKPTTPAKPFTLNDTTYLYEPSVTTIKGIVCRMAVYRLQHEEDTIPLDTIIAVAFQHPISVIDTSVTDTLSPDFQNEYGVDTVQLVMMANYDSVHKFVGRNARLTGTFYHWDNGNQKTPVLMTVQQITAGTDSASFK